MVSGILFDKDGTLIEFKQIWHPIIKGVFTKLEQEYHLSEETLQEIKRISGYRDGGFERESMIQYYATSEIIKSWMKIMETGEDRETLGISANTLMQLIEEQATDPKLTVIPIEGVEELLTYLKNQGYKLGIATADSRLSTINTLKKAKLYDYFDYIGCDEDGVAPKPSKDILLQFSGRMNLKTEEILVVGDSITDMEFAENAGAKFVGIKTDYNNHELFIEKNKVTVEQIKDIIPLLGL